MFSRTDRFGTRPSTLRSSGTSTMPALIAAPAEPGRTGEPSTRTSPESSALQAGEGLHGLAAPGPEQPAQPDDLAGPHLQVDAVEDGGAAQVVRGEHGLALAPRARR